jgi:hypothetical protein
MGGGRGVATAAADRQEKEGEKRREQVRAREKRGCGSGGKRECGQKGSKIQSSALKFCCVDVVLLVLMWYSVVLLVLMWCGVLLLACPGLPEVHFDGHLRLLQHLEGGVVALAAVGDQSAHVGLHVLGVGHELGGRRPEVLVVL